MTQRSLLLLAPLLGLAIAIPSCGQPPADKVANDSAENHGKDKDKAGAETPNEAGAPVDAKTDPQATSTPATPTPTPTPTANREPSSYLVARGVGPSEHSEGYPKFRIFSGHDRDVYISYGPWLMRPKADGTLVRDPAWITGVDPAAPSDEAEMAIAWTVHSAGGRWPDGLFMSVQYTAPGRGDVYPNRTYRWMGEGWRELDTRRPRYSHYPERITPWIDDSVLALRSFTPLYSEQYDEMGPPKAEERAIAKAIAKVKPLAVLRGLPKAPRLDEAVRDVDSLPSGELVGLAAGAAKVLHYDASTERTIVRPLPGDDPSLNGIVLAAANRGYVFGSEYDEATEITSSYLARFDGSAWTSEKGPPCGSPISAVSWAESSGLWAICSSDAELWVFPTGELWHQTDGGWVEIELPLRGSVTGVVADGPGGLWITTTRAVFGPKAPAEVPTFGGFKEIATSIAEYAEPSDTPLACADFLEFFYVLLKGERAEDHTADHAGEHAEDHTADHAEELAMLASALPGEDAQGVNLAVVEFRGTPRLALQIHHELEPKNIKRIQRAFGDSLGETHCFVREPMRTLP